MTRTVVHLLPADERRGAQRYARLLADGLDGPSERHLVVTAFRAPAGEALPDRTLDVPATRLRPLDPRPAGRLRRLLEQERTDVLVAHGSEVLRHVCAARVADVPVVLLRVGTNSRMSPLASRFHRQWHRRADAVVGVSSEALQAAVDLGLDDGRPRLVIPNGRSPHRYRPLANRAAGPLRLVWIGSLDSGKRPHLFLDAVGELRAREKEFEATIIGDGPLRAGVAQRGRELGVTVLGSRSDVPDLLPTFDVLVFTAQPPEGMPGVLIEGGFCGLPAVTTVVPGARDVVDHERTGFVVASTATAVADAVQLLVEDVERCREMGAAGRLRCVEHFDLERTFEQWRALLSNVRRR